ncbi:CPBP family intramembrane metalloprotease [Candidatus Saccharibacteria bacterium]|nr:CPBP family intramembrane metalloprotease [Candidatus Saccharibacteria bacterium]
MTKKRGVGELILTIVGMCIWVFAVVIATQLVIGYIMLSLLGKSQFNQPVWTSVYSAVVYILALIITVFVPLLIQNKRKKKKIETPAEMRKELGLDGLPTWTDVGLGPIGFIASLLLAALLVFIFSKFPWFVADQTQDLAFSVMSPGFNRVLAFLTLVVVAPIAEEIIFRGWLYGKLREKLNGKLSEIWGIIISSFIASFVFGLVHLQWNVGVNVFALSIVLCAMREITGTIYAGMLTHIIKNGVAFYLIYVIGVI